MKRPGLRTYEGLESIKRRLKWALEALEHMNFGQTKDEISNALEMVEGLQEHIESKWKPERGT